jgi:uncharacterized membrane protein
MNNFGHPVHQMLIVYPAALLMTSFVFDLVWLATDVPAFNVVSYWILLAGCIAAVIAAFFGFLDWSEIPASTRAKRMGTWHAVLNSIVLVMFLVSFFRRHQVPSAQPDEIALTMSAGAAALLGIAAWLGGELAEYYGIGVDTAAHPNADRISGTTDALTTKAPRVTHR